MTLDIGPGTGPALELGPETGPFIRALLSRVGREKVLTLIGSAPDFAALLKRRFPAARIFEMDAVGLRHVSLFQRPVFGAAVTGLPFRRRRIGPACSQCLSHRTQRRELAKTESRDHQSTTLA
ncbi:phospholipid N-methyltransferase [Mesorhizobium robiniae]|uniref:Phospholipid N-methyltransferase n=1 Tax=Mesorhizobium robiniae TaxID=559315 RepID=A0ABV2H015_9HYPH